MERWKGRKEGNPLKTRSCGEHESQRGVQRKKPEPGPGTGPGPGSGPGTGPETSCVSFKSDKSMYYIIDFKGSDSNKQPMIQQSTKFSSNQSVQQPKARLESIFEQVGEQIIAFVKQQLNKICKDLSRDNSKCQESQREDEVLEGENAEQSRSIREAFEKITVSFLRRSKQVELADRVQHRHVSTVCQHKLKSALKRKYQCVFEGIAKAGNPMLLNQIYTELYITEGGTGEVNDEHEVRQIETTSRKPFRPETKIRQEDIFKLLPERDGQTRTVMTKGVAGIGKTVLTQKFTLDWAEDKANQDIHLLFPFTFRELNLLQDKKFSLVELVHHFFTETKEIKSFEEFQVVFIFDGLDECRLSLDFHNKKILTDVTESASVDVLLTNLIRGKLLPSARLWINTRPAAANQIPPECVDMVTEVRGFTDIQKDQYFRNRFREGEQANRIISHIKTLRSLHIMCHIPVFCWITSTVLEDMMKTREGGELPRSLTEMFIHFLVVQAKVKKVKYDGGVEADPHWSPESRKMIESLGKLAFYQLQKKNLIFYESDLTECGIDIGAASVYSGVFTQIFKEERGGLYQDRVFCFVHLSVQEFLAALHSYLTFSNYGVNLMGERETSNKVPSLLNKPKPLNRTVEDKETVFYKSAVDKALESSNGHLDLFLRFLLGLSLQTNRTLLRGMLTQRGSSSQTNQETIQYIKEKISKNMSVEKNINLFYCLNELNDDSLVMEIQKLQRSGYFSIEKLSAAHLSALIFLLLSSEKDLDLFDLKKFSASETVLLKLLPVVKASNKAILSDCILNKESCEALSSVLSSQSSRLRELDLRIHDSGVKPLSDGLLNPKCKLKIIRLGVTDLSDDCSVAALSSLLSTQTFNLKEQNRRNLEDLGVQRPSEGQRSQHYHLSLWLSFGKLSEKNCEVLSSAISSHPSDVKELDMSKNKMDDSGVKLLNALKSPNCPLETLRTSLSPADSAG
ncbi:NLR family CARD domain-containing protein 3 isoform X3 [Nothobranchius furzeri]|uniref:NLR family CARD domain-containing protein 3 isoform X3 n=1 Tax=Nothobranchius furzeri TaxID=105023 RepID=UPI0039047808